MKTKITACLIVKNEEENIEQCLDSIKDYVSQIVVVDTGSNDLTPAIATNNNVDLFFHKWNDNFADARNNSLKYARNEWILIIDADEVIESFEIDESILNNPKIGGLTCTILNNLNEHNDLHSKHTYTRLFRNNPQIRFSGNIHEQIKESILSQNLEIVNSDIIIRHFGYINTSDEKKLRNKELLEKTDLNDDFNKMNLADTEFSLEKFDKSKDLYLSVVNSDLLSLEQKEKVKIRLAQISLKQNLIQDVLTYTNFKSTDLDFEGLRKFVLAAAYLESKNIAEAKNLYNSDEVTKSNLVDKDIVNKALEVLNKLQ